MKIRVLSSFEKDVLKVKNKKLAIQLQEVIEIPENSASLAEVNHLKKIKSKGSYYRIRV
jgi:hypothetical protein